MNKDTLRERREKERRQKRIKMFLIIGGAVLAFSLLTGYLVWRENRPLPGERVPVMANAAEHVAAGEDPGPFNSNPPSSGRHYGQPMEAGFYEENDPAAQVPHPEGYILHSLEHGYVVFWYNCQVLEEEDCSALKSEIRDVMDGFQNFKVIGFSWAEMDVPAALTSWGRIQTFETFDPDLARKFVQANRYQAPEPNAP
ncbi:MAG: DUF3105 domain-containing protein [Anaerolineales bacterium]|nr:DUF3105 domain-containing protein [Anaerolineales bacterium]